MHFIVGFASWISLVVVSIWIFHDFKLRGARYIYLSAYVERSVCNVRARYNSSKYFGAASVLVLITWQIAVFVAQLHRYFVSHVFGYFTISKLFIDSILLQKYANELFTNKSEINNVNSVH